MSLLERTVSRVFYRNSVSLEDSISAYHEDLLSGILKARLTNIDSVSEKDAMKVPAVFNAVGFLAGTVAGLPFQAFEPDGNGAKVINGFINRMVERTWNPHTSSFLARFSLMISVLLHGRGFIYIARNAHNIPRELYVLDQCLISPDPSSREYWLAEVDGLPRRIPDSDIIYIPFLCSSKTPRLAYGLLSRGARAVNICLAIQEYLAGYFDSAASGNFAAEAPVSSEEAYSRFRDKISESVESMKRNKTRVLTLPHGTNFTTISNDSRRSQLVENRIESVREIARFFSVPPVVLGENSGTTWSLQDIDRFLSMHTVKRWKNVIEQEFQHKLFPNSLDKRFVRLDLSELQRAMLKDRLESYRIAINSGQLTPNEARENENLPEYKGEGGDKLYMQGATVPIDDVGKQNQNQNQNEPDDDSETDPVDDPEDED